MAEQNFKKRITSSYLSKIFTLKIILKVVSFWFCFNCLMNSFEYFFDVCLKTYIVDERIYDLRNYDDSYNKKSLDLTQYIIEHDYVSKALLNVLYMETKKSFEFKD